MSVKSLRDLSFNDIDRALNVLGARRGDAGMAMVERLDVQPRFVKISVEMLGMGHNEPRSYGTVYSKTFTLKEILEALNG